MALLNTQRLASESLAQHHQKTAFGRTGHRVRDTVTHTVTCHMQLSCTCMTRQDTTPPSTPVSLSHQTLLDISNGAQASSTSCVNKLAISGTCIGFLSSALHH
jgi:hypothetical protein